MSAHILHIAPTPFFADRGCHIRIQGIVRCLTQLGYSNIVCTYHHGRDISDINTRRIKPINAYTQTAAGPNKYKLLADWRLLWVTVSEYRRQRPTVIHAHLHEGLLIGLIVKSLFFWHRTPILADMQGSLSGELDAHSTFKKYPLLRWPIRLIEKLLMRFPNAIVCSNQHSLTKMRDEFGVHESKISLAQDGADPFPAASVTNQTDLKTHWALPKDKVLLVYSGALLNSKGLKELQALLLNLKKEPKLHALIIGYPTNNLETFLAQNELNKNCTLTGQVDFTDLPTLLSLADIAVDPKHSDAGEGSGKMLNYLACGLPTVAFDTLNNRQFLPPNSTLAKTIQEMTEQILLLVHNAELRQQQGLNARKYFLQHHSWAITRKQLEAVYKTLL